MSKTTHLGFETQPFGREGISVAGRAIGPTWVTLIMLYPLMVALCIFLMWNFLEWTGTKIETATGALLWMFVPPAVLTWLFKKAKQSKFSFSIDRDGVHTNGKLYPSADIGEVVVEGSDGARYAAPVTDTPSEFRGIETARLNHLAETIDGFARQQGALSSYRVSLRVGRKTVVLAKSLHPDTAAALFVILTGS